MYRPYHLIGLELSVSVLKVGLLDEATGTPHAFLGDVVATAKRNLAAGEVLDGEGGYCVYGKLLPAGAAVHSGTLPIGLAHGVKLKRAVAAGETVRWEDVVIALDDPIVRLRKEMEARL
jgi:predicted homoserine dehydrogenase-like protein